MKIGYLMQVGEDIRQPPFNGPANHVRQITRELAHRGHSVRVLYRLGNQIWLSDDLIDFRPVPFGEATAVYSACSSALCAEYRLN